MGLRGPHCLLFLTVLLLAACLAHFRLPNSFQWFVRKHVDFPKTSTTNDHRYCTLIMPRWNLTTPFCKPSHTFIHAPASHPRPCQPAPTRSSTPLPVIHAPA
ncbi:unnamed protein product, partial [Eretmochelys imbricata]